jgi:hypothetical protein
MQDTQHPAQGPKYFIDIEGTEEPWSEAEISIAQIRTLAGWDPTQGVVEVDLQDNSERTLGNDEVVELKPGHGFAKKVRFQRG